MGAKIDGGNPPRSLKTLYLLVRTISFRRAVFAFGGDLRRNIGLVDTADMQLVTAFCNLANRTQY
jgi:hypothetical protein